jgi:1,4-dihydroxy-2-naphthoate octaprenyltransferase
MQRFIKLFHPLDLLFIGLSYCLGAGIAHYLVGMIHWPAFSLGLLGLLFLQIGSEVLRLYFKDPVYSQAPEQDVYQNAIRKTRVLQAAFAALALFAAAGLSLLITRSMNEIAGLLLILELLVMIAYAVPPIQLAESGFGELAQSVSFAILVPAFAFALQLSHLHRLLPLTTFPLTLLGIACLLVVDFPTYGHDLREHHSTLLIRLTWQRAIPVHAFLISAAFLLFASEPFFGVPLALVWPVFLSFPFALVQVVWMQRIARGGPAMWGFLIPLAYATFALAVYLLTFAFWLH